MKVLSIDVGIKNLAFCLLEKLDGLENFNIKKWDVINVSEEEILKCCSLEKNIVCNKPAKFEKEKQYYCLKHSKKQCYQIPTLELKPAFINKQNIQKLYELADKYNISYEKHSKKQVLVNIIKKYISDTCFNPIININASKVDLINIGKNIKIKFEKIFEEEEIIDYIIIENQISPIANRMKTIQGMISQYFIMKNTCQNIEFISASNKLKEIEPNNTKTNYSDRKKQGVIKCLEILNNNHQYNEWVENFTKSKKKDDLSDSFLQGIWFIKNKSL